MSIVWTIILKHGSQIKNKSTVLIMYMARQGLWPLSALYNLSKEKKKMITVTEKALQEIKRIMEEQELDPTKTALRVRVVGGGCSGFETKLDLDEKFSENTDNVSDIGGVKVAVDRRSSMYLEGATVDFHDSLEKRGFLVNNPNAKNTCGCGKSFSM